MELQGEIILIGETAEFGTKGFKKRQMVVKTDSLYPQSIPIDFTQDKCVLLDSYQVGDFVEVGINIQGSEWKEKYYVNLNGWKISKGSKEKSSESFMPDRDASVSDLPF
tara:strand:- start:616 stop:942 length:327 start_codon:yes stop_codon:yes gene_type:complete